MLQPCLRVSRVALSTEDSLNVGHDLHFPGIETTMGIGADCVGRGRAPNIPHPHQYVDRSWNSLGGNRELRSLVGS